MTTKGSRVFIPDSRQARCENCRGTFDISNRVCPKCDSDLSVMVEGKAGTLNDLARILKDRIKNIKDQKAFLEGLLIKVQKTRGILEPED